MIAALGGAYFFSNFHRLALGVLGAQISADLSLTSLQTGTLGSALFYSYALMQIPCGYISDRVSARVLVSLACLLTAAGTVWFACASSFAAMVAARALTGVSTSLVYIPALSAIRRQFGDASFGAMTGIMVAMGQMGAVSAASPLKWLSSLWGWRNAFAVIGAVTVVLGALAWALVKDADGEKTVHPPLSVGLKCAGTPLFGAVAAWFFVTGGTRLCFQGLWGGMFFIKGRGFAPGEAGLLLTLVSLGCIIGSLLMGRLSDVWGNVRTMIAGSLALVVVWLGLGCASDVEFFAAAGLCLLLGAAGAGGFTVGFSSIRLFAAKENTGLLTGIVNLFAFLGSALFTQLSGSIISTLPCPDRQKYSALLIVFAALCCVSTCVLGFAWRREKR